MEEKLCIPGQLQNDWIQELHKSTGHVEKETFWQMVGDKHEWADRKKPWNFRKL